jgi:hypothetical protein
MAQARGADGAGFNPYGIVRPCAMCPFRSDIEPYLTPLRAREIATSLRYGAGFACHLTTATAEDEEGADTRVEAPWSMQCAGALITMEREGVASQLTRIAERLGLYHRNRLDMNAPTYEALAAWERAHTNT